MSVKCLNPQCGKDNADNHQFCAFCGVPLGDLRTIVNAIIIERLKDKESVEVTTAIAIAKRAWEWAETLAKFGGAALVVFVGGLIFFGYGSLKDVQEKREAAKNLITNQAAQVLVQAKEVQSQLSHVQATLAFAATLSNQMVQLKSELTNAEVSLADLVALSNRISGIEQYFAEYTVPPEQSNRFNDYLRDYQIHLTKIGFQTPTQKLEFRFTAKKDSESDDQSYSGNPFKVVAVRQ